jgi:hypothetical protein
MTGAMRASSVSLALLILLAGCAHVTPRERAARTLVAVGAVAILGGGLTAAGCVDDEGDGCSGGPGDANLAVGLPVMAVGAGLLTVGLLMRSRSSGRLLPPPAPPPPFGPEPFVQPITAAPSF